ncbi:MAG: UDP-N-acetylmuramoyl-L-alanine--D-glutamate ligase [Nitrospirae bacterium]|nr:UDP-N-acetylmuramoyl-L-alanine--D-glutamate ligase [Nitrospirota bacterium]
MEVKDKKILIFGLARSGVGAANLLSKLGAEVTVTDKKSEGDLADFITRLLPSVKLRIGGHPDEIFMNMDLIVVSPGVPLDISLLKKAHEKGIEIIGELELAYQIISSEFKVQASKYQGFLAVTGTNGKSTTTTLLDMMLRKHGFRTVLGGNIGNALSEEIQGTLNSQLPTPDYVVAEVSSFQLESIDKFKPKGATILNITPDHLDRYHSMGEYKDAKARISLNQQEEDFLVLNADDPEVMKVGSERLKVKSRTPRIFYFSRKKKVEGAYYKDGVIYFNMPDVPSIFNLQSSTFRIKGVHNLENAMAASAMALLAKCSKEAVVSTLKEFPGLEHRLEFVRELEGVSYINDSKGTNVGAVVKSLESFSKPVVLIAGGRDKEGDFSVLKPFVKNRVKTIILIGEAREKIKKILGNLTETKFADSLKEAVLLSKSYALKGDVVLLSPACASFDMFKDFEDRGRQFKKIVMELGG